MKSRGWNFLAISIAACLSAWWSYQRAYTTSAAIPVSGRTVPAIEFRSEPDRNHPGSRVALQQLLKQRENSRTTGESWAIIRGFSTEEIRHSIADLAADSSPLALSQTAMLYHRWAQIDPFAAMEGARALAEDRNREMMLKSALTAWMKQDPDTAFRWAGKFPQLKLQESARMITNLISGVPPAEALAKARSYGPEVHQQTLLKLAGDLSVTPEDRGEFLTEILAAVGSEDDKTRALSMFVETWGRGDPLTALDAMEGLALEDVSKEKSRDRITRDWAEKDPAAALSWLVAKENAQPLKLQVDLYTRWVAKDPKAAVKQLEVLVQQSPDLREAVMDSLVRSSTVGGWSPFGSSSKIDDANFQRLNTHFSTWREKSPEEASGWLSHQKTGLQEKINHAPDHENR